MKVTPLLKDILERTVWTFAQGFIVVVLAAGTFDMSVFQAAGLAGGMAVLAFVKSLAASKIGAKTPQLGVETYK